jgi:hypothetical protein
MTWLAFGGAVLSFRLAVLGENWMGLGERPFGELVFCKLSCHQFLTASSRLTRACLFPSFLAVVLFMTLLM